MLSYFYVEQQINLRHQPKLQKIASKLFLTSQLKPRDMLFLRLQHIQTIVDMRPDGEEADQPSSTEMQRAATADHLKFHYVPVPHDSIPDTAVDSLKAVLDENHSRTVLYCRTGRRAVRLFALVSASQKDGPNAEDILNCVRAAGFTADDLSGNIQQRIAKRNTREASQKP